MVLQHAGKLVPMSLSDMMGQVQQQHEAEPKVGALHLRPRLRPRLPSPSWRTLPRCSWAWARGCGALRHGMGTTPSQLSPVLPIPRRAAPQPC